MLGIDNERALRLLHKTQSAKNLGDLNVFLRDFMLDAPETFAVADRLVLEFGELNEAHQAVVAARRQIETLLPAREEYEVRGQLGRELNELAEVEAGIDHYRAAQRAKLFSERIAELALEAEASRLKAGELSLAVERESEKLDALRRRRDELGGNLLEQLQKRIEETERQKEPRMKKRDAAKAACEAMGWTLPGEVLGFVQRDSGAGSLPFKAEDLAALFLRLAEFAFLEGFFGALQVFGGHLHAKLLLHLAQIERKFFRGLVALVARFGKRPLHDRIEFGRIRLQVIAQRRRRIVDDLQ